MSEEKSKGGRPRKYSTNAERQKAYYERKKQRVKELEKRISKLEKGSKKEQKKITKMDVEKASFPWKKITPAEIALIGKDELERLITIFTEKIAESSFLMDSILNLIITTLDIDSHEITDLTNFELGDLSNEIDLVIQFSKEYNQQQTLLYLLEAELSSRERSIERDFTLDILELETEEFLKEKKKDEIKIRK